MTTSQTASELGKKLFVNYIRVMPVTSDFELEFAARLAWREVADNTALVDSLIASMRSRYREIVDVVGSHSKY